MLSQHIGAEGQYAHKPGLLKAVYLAPARALVQARIGISTPCRMRAGDTGQEGLEALDAADIICATPEKFDSATRSGMRFFADIGMMLIDEVHLLNESRGSSLEGVVARIKMISRYRLREMKGHPISSVRFVAVSATIPNIQDLARWLAVPPSGVKFFGEEMRPVKLRTVVRGYNPTKTDFLFERRLNDFTYQIVAEHSSGKPTLIFCSSRKGTSETAAHLAREAGKHAGRSGGSTFVRDAGQAARLAAAAAGLKNGQLRDCIAAGVGFHHAAMEPEERAAVEALFIAQDLPVLCTTSTLALGVNLPARLVVIKGTRRYVGSEAEDASGYQEYERSTCLQMVGRAGRPQFDTEGVAVIMTQKPHARRYEQLTSGSEVVESQLRAVLPELLNAEIVLRTIGDVSQAIAWARCTYLYVRMQRSPGAYGVPPQPSAEAFDRWLRDEVVLPTVHELAKHGMVRLQEDGFGLEPLQPGRIMAERYIRMRSMVSLVSMEQGAAIPDLIGVLNEVNHSGRLRYPIMNPAKPTKVLERIATAAHKIHILVNEGLADSPSEQLDYSLRQEVEQVVAAGKRIAGAMVRFFEHVGRASETFNALLLCKSLHRRLWTDSKAETRQLAGIGPLIAQRLAAAGVHTLKQLEGVEPRRLEALAQRHYPFVERVGSSAAPSPARLLVGSLHDNALLLCRSLALDSFTSPLVLLTRTRSRVVGHDAPVQVVASIVHERLIGFDMAVRTSVPRSARLQAHLPLPSQGQTGSASQAGCQPSKQQAAVSDLQRLPAVQVEVAAGGGTAAATTEPMLVAAAPGGLEYGVEPAAPAGHVPARGSGSRRSGRLAEAASGTQLPLPEQPYQVASLPAPRPTAVRRQAVLGGSAEVVRGSAAAGKPGEAVSQAAAAAPHEAAAEPRKHWQSFLAQPAQPGPHTQPQALAQQTLVQGAPMQQLSLQATLQRHTAAAGRGSQPQDLAGWKQQKAAPAALGAGYGIPVPGPGNAPPTRFARAAAEGQGLGGPFSRFAFKGGSSTRAGAPASNPHPAIGPQAAAAAAAVAAPAWHLPATLGSLPLPAEDPPAPVAPNAAAAGVGEDNSSKRRRKEGSTVAPTLTPPPAKASKLNLPKLGWLSTHFAGAAAAVPTQQAESPAANIATVQPDFAPLFGFL
ncbi:ATP-dependent DNA helicase MER3 [Chlorella vulgaris]